MSMNIFAPKGTKVKFKSCSKDQWEYFGFDNPKGLLKKGKVYTVASTDVRSSFTEVRLQEFPNHQFNSVCFDEVAA